MTTHTGFGRSNEVAYTYDLFDDSWYGRYMCRVEESLLDHPLREFYTDHFNIGGYPWQLFLQRTSDGDLSAFLYSKSTCSSFVYFSIALVNRNDEKSKVWGSSKEFTSMPSWGVKKLASVLDIKDANNGFIHRGFFIVRLKMRLRLPGNEFRSLATDEGTKVFTWKLKDLHERSPHCMVTEPLHVGDSTWRIVLYPRGKGREKEYMAVCLCLDDESSAKAKFQVSVVNHVSTAKSISKEFVHSFTKCGQSHGFDQFLVSDLLDHELSGFIKDGWITLTARISKCCKSVQFAEAPKVHQPKVRPPVAEAPKVHQPKVRPPVALLSELHLDERQRSIPSATVEEVPKVEPQQEEKETHRRRGSKYLDMIQSTNSALWDLKNQKKPLESVVQKQAIVRTILDHECYTDRIDEKEDVIRSRSLGDIPRWLANAGPEDDESDREYDLSESLSGLVAGVSFANKYLIEAESSEGKPDVRLAINKHSRQSVILKFYPTRQLFEKSLEFTQMLCPSHVSKAIEVIYNDKDQYPPCLVFERGSETLEQWMQSSNTDLWRKKSTLRRVLECLRHIHSYGIVHCDVKPTNVMYFSSSDSWKLLDTELGAKKGETRAIHNTLYASPVTLQIEGSGRTAITLDTSVDIWSYGVIAYEVLSGVRVSGMLTSGQMLKNWMSGSRLPGLNVADDRQAKEWLEHLLCTDARYRWSAEMALGHAFLQRTKVQKPHEFHSVVSSANEVKSEVPETKCEAPQMKNEVAEVMKEDVKLNGMTLEEMRAANLMITIVLEESALIDGSSSWKSKNFRETMMMHHDTMQNEPVFLLLVGRPLRLRVGLKHKTKERSSSRKISGVRVRASDGNSVLLMTEETRSASAGHEVVAFLNPTDLKSMKFRRVSPTVGTPEEKYATLEVSVDVTCEEGGVSQTTVWKGEVVCNMIKYGRRINFRRFLERTGDVWNSTPEWMKEGAKGAIILATVGTGSWN